MTVENISLSIPTKLCDQAVIELTTSESAISLTTDCAMGPGTSHFYIKDEHNEHSAFLAFLLV